MNVNSRLLGLGVNLKTTLKQSEEKENKPQEEDTPVKKQVETLRDVPSVSGADIMAELNKTMIHGPAKSGDEVTEAGEEPLVVLVDKYKDKKRQLQGHITVEDITELLYLADKIICMMQDGAVYPLSGDVDSAITQLNWWKSEKERLEGILRELNGAQGDRANAEEEATVEDVIVPEDDKKSKNIQTRSSEETYESVLVEAANLNKILWGEIEGLLLTYGLENPRNFEEIGDNNLDPDDRRFKVLRELGEKLSKEEWKHIKDMVDELVKKLSDAHVLNNYDMEGRENQMKHPLQFGIIVNIIDPYSYLYE